MSTPDIPLDDPDRATAAALLDEVMCGDHSNDSANAVVAQALKDAALTERSRWEQALADSKLPEIYKRLVRDLATEEPCNCPDRHCGDCGCCTCLTCGHTPENHDLMRPFRHDYDPRT